jgi:hypothetical protein
VVVAVVTRLGTLYARRSLADGTGYDPSVYYASADALVHGLVPYRDYTLLHPPGLTLILSPLALIGRATTDNTGFVLATMLSMLVGAANSLLVFRIVRKMDLPRTAAAVAGLLYAVSQLSVQSETDAHLEGWGNLFVLLGIWWYLSAGRTGSPRASVLTGAALAAATSIKLWYAVPLGVGLLWHLVDRRGGRRLLLAVAGAVGAAALIDGPFLLLAGRQLVSMVVIDQVDREPGTTLGKLSRASELGLGNGLVPNAAQGTQILIAVLAGIVVAGSVAAAASIPAGRLPSALLVVQLLVLFGSPVFLWFYADYMMPALCLAVGAAVSAVQGRGPVPRRSGAVLGAALVALSCVVLVRVDVTKPRGAVLAAPGAAMTRATAGARCVQSTSPMPLILLNVLSRDFENGCRQWVDVSGRTYGVDRSPDNLSRPRNRRWHRDVLGYLLSGDQFVLVDVKREGLNRRTLAVLRRAPVIAHSRDFKLRQPVPGQVVAHAGG